MLSFSTALKLAGSVVLALGLSACSQKNKKEEGALADSSRRPTSMRGSAGLADSSRDLRQSSKFSTLSQNIRFDVGSAELTSSSRRALDEIEIGRAHV